MCCKILWDTEDVLQAHWEYVVKMAHFVHDRPQPNLRRILPKLRFVLWCNEKIGPEAKKVLVFQPPAEMPASEGWLCKANVWGNTDMPFLLDFARKGIA